MTRLLERQEILNVLSDSSSRIEAAAAGLSDAQLASRPESEEWSPVEILGHLRACADVWGDQRIGGMLSEDEPTMRAVNPKRWMRDMDYDAVPFRTSFEAFSIQRRELLKRLQSISPSDWQRGATLTGGGAPRRYSVHSEADAIARHERAHIKQIEKRCALLREGATRG